MDWAEIHEYSWVHLVPHEKKERAFRHARNLGILHESLIQSSFSEKASRLTPLKAAQEKTSENEEALSEIISIGESIE